MWYNPLIYREMMAEDFWYSDICDWLFSKAGSGRTEGRVLAWWRQELYDGEAVLNESATLILRYYDLSRENLSLK